MRKIRWCARTKSRPSLRPRKYPTESPRIAPTTTTIIRSPKSMTPCAASAPARSTVVSPGTSSPTIAEVSRKVRAKTIQSPQSPAIRLKKSRNPCMVCGGPGGGIGRLEAHEHCGGDSGGPAALRVAGGGHGHVRRREDLAFDHELTPALVPTDVLVALDTECARQHAGRQILGEIAGFLSRLSVALVLAQIPVERRIAG